MAARRTAPAAPGRANGASRNPMRGMRSALATAWKDY